MAQLHKSAATLRIMGDDLIPEEVTSLLGSNPTSAYRKGQMEQLRSGRTLIRRSGMWRLEALDCEPENVDGQVSEILGKLTSDLDVWTILAARFQMDLYCGWFMQETNEGLTISPKTMLALASRGIELGIDIYGPLYRRQASASS